MTKHLILEGPKRVRPGTPWPERIYLHTDRSGDCWLWLGATNGKGYGVLTIDKRLRYAHRISYEAFVGPIGKGLEVDHLCRVRSCCKPSHLEPVTPQVNVRRGESPGANALRRDACLHGHPYSEHGTLRQGRRICRACRVGYMRIYNRMKPDEIAARKAAGLPVVDLAAHFASTRELDAAA